MSPTPDDDRRRDEDLQRELQKFASEFLVFVRPTGEMTMASDFNTLGYVASERDGHHIAEHIHPDDLAQVFDIIERARRTEGFDENVLARARHFDGSWRLFDARVFDAALRSDLKGAVLRVRDITDDHNATIAGSEAADRFLSLAEMLPLGILSADARGWVAFCNDAAQQIFNLPPDLLIGHGWEKAVFEEDQPDVLSAAGQVAHNGVPQQVTFRVRRGVTQRWAHAKFVPLCHDDLVTGWIATIEDVTDRRRAEGELAHQATHDALTGIPNRTLLDDRLHQARARLRRDSTSITVLFIDLDGFKGINDTLGHHAGDRVLIECAGRLRAIMRDIDTLARLGGDEFVAVCESLPEDEVLALVDRVHEALDVTMLIEGREVRVGASVGVARTYDAEHDVIELLAQADQAMYRDKQLRKARTG